MYAEITSHKSRVCRIESQIGIIVVLWCFSDALKMIGQESLISSQSTNNSLSFSSIDAEEFNRGRSETLRFVNGTDVEPGKYQFIGVLYNKKIDVCAAALIAPDVALCGCHCLVKTPWNDWNYPQELADPRDIQVLIDCVDLSNIRGQMRRAKTVRVHQNCTKTETKVTYDYGLVRFTEPFLRIFGYVDTMEIPHYETPALIDEMIQNEEPCVVVGWAPQRGKSSPRMKEFDAKLRRHKWCTLTVHYLTEFNKGGPDIYLPDHHFCMSPLREGESSCFGDNIGPLLCGEGFKFLIGIFSFVPRADICGSSVLPTVGSRLDVVYDWIETFLHQKPSDDGRSDAAIHTLNLYVTSSLLLCTLYIA